MSSSWSVDDGQIGAAALPRAATARIVKISIIDVLTSIGRNETSDNDDKERKQNNETTEERNSVIRSTYSTLF